MRVLPALVAVAALISGQSPAPARLALVGGTVVDVSAFGTSSNDLRDATVIVEGGRIAAVGPRASTRIPSATTVIDISGKFLVPGFTDVFATLNNQAYANAFLYMGVTSIVGLDEPGGRRGPLFTAAAPSPRVYKFEAIEGYDDTGVTPPPRTIHELMTRGRKMTPAELTAQVDAFATSGVKVLLLHYPLAPDQIQAVAAHARARGIATIGELGATTYQAAMAAGVMAFVHTSRYSLELAPPDLRAQVADAPFGPPRVPYYEYLSKVPLDDPNLAAYAAALARSGVGLIPTLSLNYLDLPGHRNPWREPAAALLDPADIHLPADRRTGTRPPPANGTSEGFPPGATEHLTLIESRYCKAGVHYLAGSGTDAFGTMPGISLHTELELLVKACLTPRQALAAATANVGAIFGWRNIGEVRPGYNADLVVLGADPTRDVTNLKRIDQVVLAGTLLDRGALLNGKR